jgi:hypothetical protein
VFPFLFVSNRFSSCRKHIYYCCSS